jgi:TonB family protein
MTLEIVANAAIRMMLLAAAAWLLMRAFRVRNAHVEGLVWRLTLLAGFALPALLYWRVAPSFTTPIEPLEIVAAIPGAAIGAAPGSTAALTTAVASIYLLVASLLLVRLIVALAVMWRICRAARPIATPDDVRISERVRSPATFGAVVLLPPDAQEWPAEKLDAVLAHERAHVQARDGYWSWLAQFHTAIFWFTPLAWGLQRRLGTLAETTADDAVVSARHDPVAYAALLLDFARYPNSRSVAMSVADSNVPKRINRLLARIPPAAALPRVARWTALALMIPVVVLAASTMRVSAAEQPSAAVSESAAAASQSDVRLSHPANPDDFYPKIAQAQGVTGFAVVEVDVDKQGKLIAARVVKAEPADPQLGFGDAALQVARATTYENTSQQTGILQFMVKFAMEAPVANSTAIRDLPRARITQVANPDDYYPQPAKREKVAGEAVVEVSVDASGKIVDVTATDVVPASPDYGFGPAAIRVARASKYANPNEEVSSIKFKVKFTPRR